MASLDKSWTRVDAWEDEHARYDASHERNGGELLPGEVKGHGESGGLSVRCRPVDEPERKKQNERKPEPTGRNTREEKGGVIDSQLLLPALPIVENRVGWNGSYAACP